MLPRPRAPRRALSALLLLACACAAPPGVREWDPWEGFNRRMFWFNERVDEYALEPAARGWEAITEPGVRTAVQDFGDNLRFPIRALNQLLQGRLADAGRTTARFGINTTLGMLGFFDPAEVLGLPRSFADFGQTLAAWGLEAGPYLVLPLVGPSDPRDAAGLVFDYGVAGSLPLTDDTFMALYVVSTVNWRAINLHNIEEARAASFDYYAAVRSAWLDDRRRAVGVPLPPEEPAADGTVQPEEDPYDVDAAINP